MDGSTSSRPAKGSSSLEQSAVEPNRENPIKTQDMRLVDERRPVSDVTQERVAGGEKKVAYNVTKVVEEKEEEEEEEQWEVRTNDVAFSSQQKYDTNVISTAKYNVVTFLPRNLFEQFLRVANFYFLVLLILQLIPQITSLSPVSTAIPLFLVLGVTAIKDGFDDYKRHVSDSGINNRVALVVAPDSACTESKWRDIHVGSILRLENNDFVPADLMLLKTSEPNGLCYVETAELDGETNLKVRQGLEEVHRLEIMDLCQFDGTILSERPNNVLDKYDGTLHWNQETFSLKNNNMLLRGCRLRNTEWAYGVVIFAGHQTKLMQNSGKARLKRTKLDHQMNYLIICIFSFLICLCIICAIASSVWEDSTGDDFQLYLPWESNIDNPQVIATLQFFSYVIVLNTLVPISLYVSVEFIRLGQSFLINWDLNMYYRKFDTAARARTTTLNEELGQIEYVFSDKTGTLTQNIMTFLRCTVNGVMYGGSQLTSGDEDVLVDVEPHGAEASATRIDFTSECKYGEKKFVFYDRELLNAARSSDSAPFSFFTALCLCHTVMPERRSDDKLVYQAQSPDEAALVSAARNFGLVFLDRTPSTIKIDVHGKEETYELLCILDFNNVRKRMSVIVRCPNGKVRLLCKGADSVIFERLSKACSDVAGQTQEHLEIYAREGLRTLCVAYRDLSEDDWQRWKQKHDEANIALVDRDDKLSAVYEEVERELMLIGASAIEDKLQDGVPDAIATLARGNIKIWVLTGDKDETAINIGYSCKLLTPEMKRVHLVEGRTTDDVEASLREFKKFIEDERSAFEKEHNISLAKEDPFEDPSKAGNKPMFALVINGYSLAPALEESLEQLFLDTASLCRAVICCRVTPLQKALVVELVKKSRGAVTLAIGDGANDVGMIKAAHIGVGISGQEGMQAVLASDYSFAQFCYLKRLLLVHGRWSYMRMCKFLSYFFYKNFAFVLVQLWFAFFCGFTAQTVYDPWFVTVYNVIFTSLPVIIVGVIDQDVNEKLCLKFPRLYIPGQQNLLFNKQSFFLGLFQGLLVSVVIYFTTYFAYRESVGSDGLTQDNLYVFGAAASGLLVVIVNLQIALDTYHWTIINHVVTWGSTILWFVYMIIVYTPGLYRAFPDFFYDTGITSHLFGSGTFWFSLFLCVVITLSPVVAWRYYCICTKPLLIDVLRANRDDEALLGVEAAEVIGRETPNDQQMESVAVSPPRTMSGKSRSSSHTGYAFSHESGFGDLITTGRNVSETPPTTHTSSELRRSSPKVSMLDSLPGTAETDAVVHI